VVCELEHDADSAAAMTTHELDVVAGTSGAGGHGRDGRCDGGCADGDRGCSLPLRPPRTSRLAAYNGKDHTKPIYALSSALAVHGR
jgi:hypothetical protein